MEKRNKTKGLLKSGLTAPEVLEMYQDLPDYGSTKLTDVNQVNSCGDRPLHVAAVHGSIAEVVALLDAGAEIDAPGDLGNTALHDAVGQEHPEVVKVLLEYGARTDVKNEFGDTPVDIARLRNRHHLVAILEGAK